MGLSIHVYKVGYVDDIFGKFLSHTLSHIPGPPGSTSHISDPRSPIFSRPNTKISDKSPLYKFYLNCLRRFLSEGFVRLNWFLSTQPSVTIGLHLLQQKVKITLNFMFHNV